MARLKDREQAIQLRKQGKSYSQIKQLLNVSKGTLNGWLRDYPLSQAHLRKLQAWSEKRIEKYRETVRIRRERHLLDVYETQRQKLMPLTTKDFLMAGFFLYAGEGAKSKDAIRLSNSNPAVIKFFVNWLRKICEIPRQEVGVRLQLYRDMNAHDEIRYWMSKLDLPRENFKNPYFKKVPSERITYKGGFGHGTCNVLVGKGSARLFEKIMMSIKVVEDQLSALSSARLEQRTYKPQVPGSNPGVRTTSWKSGT